MKTYKHEAPNGEIVFRHDDDYTGVVTIERTTLNGGSVMLYAPMEAIIGFLAEVVKSGVVNFVPEDDKPAEPNRYASVSWNAEDVKDLTNPPMTDEQAEDFLAKYESGLQDLMVERGHDAIDTYLAMEGLERADDDADEDED